MSGSALSLDVSLSRPAILPGSWVALRSATRSETYTVKNVVETSRAAYALTGKITRLTLDSRKGFNEFTIRGTTVFADSEQLAIAQVPIVDPVEGTTVVLDRPYLGLTAGRRAVVSAGSAGRRRRCRYPPRRGCRCQKRLIW